MTLPNASPTSPKPKNTSAGNQPCPLRDGLAKTIDYFKSIDLTRFRKPTDHTAHKSSDR